MIKKIIYLMLATFIGLGVGYIEYQNEQTQHTLKLVEEALNDEEYVDIAKIFGGLFDSESIVDFKNDNVDNVELVIFPGTTEVYASYGDEHNPTEYRAFEKSYNFYLFKNNFDLASSKDDKGNNINHSGIRFISGDKAFNYYFVANENVNAVMYEDDPDDVLEATLYNDRDYLTIFENVKFMSISFTETMIKGIVDELNGSIEKIQIISSYDKVVYEYQNDFAFEEKFFLDCGSMIEQYDSALKAYDNAKTDAERAEIQKEFNENYNSWIEDFNNMNHPTYTFGFDKEHLTPPNLVKSVAIAVGIYLLCAILLYILFFHRKMIKRLFCKIFGITIAEEQDDDYDDVPIEEDMIDVDAGVNLAKVLRKKYQFDDDKNEELEVIELEEVYSDDEIAYSSPEDANE
jgi:hypothetical protein